MLSSTYKESRHFLLFIPPTNRLGVHKKLGRDTAGTANCSWLTKGIFNTIWGRMRSAIKTLRGNFPGWSLLETGWALVGWWWAIVLGFFIICYSWFCFSFGRVWPFSFLLLNLISGLEVFSWLPGLNHNKKEWILVTNKDQNIWSFMWPKITKRIC